MGSETKSEVIGGLKVKCAPLAPMASLDLLPELLEFATAWSGASDDGALIASVGKLLRDKKLRTLLPQLLAGTTVMVPESGREIPLQLDSDRSIDAALLGHMGALAGIVALAVKVSFADFFEGAVQFASRLKAPGP